VPKVRSERSGEIYLKYLSLRRCEATAAIFITIVNIVDPAPFDGVNNKLIYPLCPCALMPCVLYYLYSEFAL